MQKSYLNKPEDISKLQVALMKLKGLFASQEDIERGPADLGAFAEFAAKEKPPITEDPLERKERLEAPAVAASVIKDVAEAKALSSEGAVNPEAMKYFTGGTEGTAPPNPPNPTGTYTDLTGTFSDLKDVDMNSILEKKTQTAIANPKFATELEVLKSGMNKGKEFSDINFTAIAGLADKWSGGGNQLLTAAQSMLEKQGSKDAALRLEAYERKQKNQQSFVTARSFNNDLLKVTKPLDELQRSAAAVRNVLRGELNAAGGRVVSVQKLNSVVTLASKLLGVMGTQTEGDIDRTQMGSITKWFSELTAKTLDPNATISQAEVNNLLLTIEEAVESTRVATSNRLQLTSDAYVTGLGLDQSHADSVMSLYQKNVDKIKPLPFTSTPHVEKSKTPETKTVAPR